MRGSQKRQELIDRFWELLEPDTDAYARKLDYVLRQLPLNKLEKVVDEMGPDDETGERT